jgi:hypothetical protein|tara:strand:- start:555 stop:1052 length:498 start_codon:yes stop_codon:yes gene_type:complete
LKLALLFVVVQLPQRHGSRTRGFVEIGTPHENLGVLFGFCFRSVSRCPGPFAFAIGNVLTRPDADRVPAETPRIPYFNRGARIFHEIVGVRGSRTRETPACFARRGRDATPAQKVAARWRGARVIEHVVANRAHQLSRDILHEHHAVAFRGVPKLLRRSAIWQIS